MGDMEPFGIGVDVHRQDILQQIDELDFYDNPPIEFHGSIHSARVKIHSRSKMGYQTAS
eukprot:CAMPEP_0202969962 /NCGR_PEP_ID=MMETSP1396-20130829/15880_1 /ASSEMBLY_ACC=CAM_ASM_000872 /TAXON_ID= /ORGANISM="Pseudokeronopsis sp., Strain Brazil" /LENGTH=58 /DNA_ID=CAMNT_0049698077 /DNA_START=43 /DNA_END=215 /DNA_ORIENTATION=+